jgi:hypothetical protein
VGLEAGPPLVPHLFIYACGRLFHPEQVEHPVRRRAL